MKTRVLRTAMIVVLFFATRIVGTNSYYSDSVTITGNTFSMAEAPVCEPTLSVPVLLTPENHTWLEETNEATFTWQGVNDGCGGEGFEYKLEAFDNDNLHGTPVFASDWLTGLTFNKTNISDKHIFWRVLARNGNGQTTESTVFHLSLKDKEPDPTRPDVVINEFLPNPTGDDSAPMPGGEWIELFNRSETTTYGLAGWSLEDDGGHKLFIRNENSTSLAIAPRSYVVVFRNGSGSFSLNNDAGGDTVSLFNDTHALIDSYTYLGTAVAENKTIARFPDGSDTWFDPIPTPNKPNRLEPKLDMSLSEDRQYLSFDIDDASWYKTLEYECNYETVNAPQGLKGSDKIDSQGEYHHPKTIMGSCSAGGTCVYDQGVKNVSLSVVLTAEDGSTTQLTKKVF